jgi:hypothetical protein
MSGDSEIYWAANLQAATVDWSGDGFLFIGMLMTTLLPTMVHLVVGLIDVVTHSAARAREIARLIGP